MPDKDITEVKKKIVSKVRAELNLRIDRGYENIDISSVEEFVDKALEEMKVK